MDFLLDAYERASGTWWRPRGEPRERTVGKLDFDAYGGREVLRRVPGFIAFAREHPEWFEIVTVPADEQIPMGHKEDFFAYLSGRSEDLVPGDAVFIGGIVPWDPKRIVHYHTLVVFESDPVSGMPIVVAGNPGKPCLRPWLLEMRRTPRRTIRYRLRPRPAWYEHIVQSYPQDWESPPLTHG